MIINDADILFKNIKFLGNCYIKDIERVSLKLSQFIHLSNAILTLSDYDAFYLKKFRLRLL